MAKRDRRPIDETPLAGGTTLIRVDPAQAHGLARVEVFAMLDDKANLELETCNAHVQLPLPPAAAVWDADLIVEVHDDEVVFTSLTITSIVGVPDGGLQTSDLRSLKLREVREAVVRALQDPESGVLFASKSPLVSTEARKPGRRGDDRTLARIAQLYLEAARAPGRVYENLATLAAEQGFGRFDRDQLRNMVDRARAKDILTRPGAGHRKASELTPLGRELLKRHPRRTSLGPGKTLADDDSEFL
jgi:hypothetical protein